MEKHKTIATVYWHSVVKTLMLKKDLQHSVHHPAKTALKQPLKLALYTYIPHCASPAGYNIYMV